MQVKLEHRSKDISCAKMLSDLDFPPVLAFAFLYISFTEVFFLFIQPLSREIHWQYLSLRDASWK